MTTMRCKHASLTKAVSLAPNDTRDGSIVVDVWCAKCGKSGSMWISPKEVMWGDDDEKPDAEAVSKRISEVAEEWKKIHEEDWGPNSDEPDPSMVTTGVADAIDLQTVANYVKIGDFKAARNKAASLDTIVRDELPEEFFHLLEDNGCPW